MTEADTEREKREQTMTEPINLAEKLAQFSEHWSPRTVAQLNAYDVIVEGAGRVLLARPR